MKHLLALAMASVLCACSHSAPQAAATLARYDEAAAMRAHPFYPVLLQLERDRAELIRARNTYLSDPSAFARSSQVVTAQVAHSNAAMVAAAQARPPITRVSYPSQLGNALAERDQRALTLARQQYAEKENTTAYEFERAHAGERLRMRLRLQTLHLDAQTRRGLLARLGALDARENAVVGAQRSIDDAALGAYESELGSSNQTLRARMAAQVRADQSIVRRPLAPIPPVDIGAAIARANAASADVTSRFAQLQAHGALDAQELATEIDALGAECDRLRSEMRADIARKINSRSIRS